MADNNLDDFFAKRDKGKKKGKKFTTVDDATKVLETKAKERIKATTGKSQYVETGESQSALSEYRQQQDEDDEWLEVKAFEPDYTGLKIQELVLEDSDDELGNKEGEVKEDGDVDGGPWNKVLANKERKAKEAKEAKEAQDAKEAKEAEEKKETSTESTEEPKEEDKPEVSTETSEIPTTEEPKKTGGYVPPNRRNVQEGKPALAPGSESAPPKPSEGGSSSSNAYVPPSRRGITTSSAASKAKKSVGMPNITNEESFPTLGS